MPDSVQAGITWRRFVLALRYGFLFGVGFVALQVVIALIIHHDYAISNIGFAITGGLTFTVVLLFQPLALPIEAPIARRVLHALTFGAVEFGVILLGQGVSTTLPGEEITIPGLGFPLSLGLGLAVLCFIVEPTLVGRPKNGIMSDDSNRQT